MTERPKGREKSARVTEPSSTGEPNLFREGGLEGRTEKQVDGLGGGEAMARRIKSQNFQRGTAQGGHRGGGLMIGGPLKNISW